MSEFLEEKLCFQWKLEMHSFSFLSLVVYYAQGTSILAAVLLFFFSHKLACYVTDKKLGKNWVKIWNNAIKLRNS